MNGSYQVKTFSSDRTVADCEVDPALCLPANRAAIADQLVQDQVSTKFSSKTLSVFLLCFHSLGLCLR
eukprot:SAG22_NODE_327_length_12278_cov_10.550209_6_plen_68_part_00